MARKQGTLDICKACKRLMKIAARGLCNTCYNKDVKSRKIITCKQCGEVRPHRSLGLCDRCYSSHRYHLDPDGWNNGTKKRRKDNPDKFRAADRARSKTRQRKDWQQKRNQEQYTANGEALKAYQKRYRASHPGFTTHHTEKYKAKKAGLIHDLTQAQWHQILDEHHHACYYCGKTGVNFHREHKIPVSRCGGYTYSNIVPACPTCNMRKHNMTDTEFFDFLRKYPRNGEGG